MSIPAPLHDQAQTLLCRSWIKKKWDKTRKFVKKHKKAIIIGAVVVVVVTGVVIGVVAASSAAAGGAALASSGTDEKSPKNNSPHPSVPNSTPAPMESLYQSPSLKHMLDHQVASFKEDIVQHQFFPPTNYSVPGLSLEEQGRTVGSIFAHQNFNNLYQQTPSYPRFDQGTQKIDSNYESIRKLIYPPT